MAIAKITLTCSKCGCTFVHRKECLNRRDADNHELWAAENITVCPECARNARANEQATALEAALAECSITLHEITGVSDKQVAYAKSVRESYLAKHLKQIKDYSKVLAFLADADAVDAYRAKCAAHGVSLEEGIRQNIEAMDLTTTKLMLTATTAREILDSKR